MLIVVINNDLVTGSWSSGRSGCANSGEASGTWRGAGSGEWGFRGKPNIGWIKQMILQLTGNQGISSLYS